MANLTIGARLAYEDNRYEWTTGQCSQGDGSKWGAGTKRWGVLYFPGLSAVKGKPISKVILHYDMGGGYSSGKDVFFYASKRSGINTTVSAEGSYMGKYLSSLSDVSNTGGSSRDVTSIFAAQIKSPASGTVGDTFVIFSASEANYLKIYEAKIQVEYTETTDCGPPTGASASPAVFEGEVTLTWSGAKAGVGNDIAGYELQYRVSADNKTFGGWAALTAVGKTDSYRYKPTLSRGSWIQFRIRTKGTEGSEYYSDWKNTGSIRRNAAPSAPASLTLNKSAYSQGDSVVLSWPAGTDADDNLQKYEVELSVNGGAWSLIKTQATRTLTLTPTQAKDGETLKYRVRAVDAFGVKGGYRESAALLREDATGIKVCTGGIYKKAWVYVCKNGAWVKGEVYLCTGGEYRKATD